jgi:CPA2 family monovalent cation:H+ antiporter-2
VSLRETLQKSDEPASSSLAGLLKTAELDSVTISADSPAAGRLIRELRLRTETGATIVGIERAGVTSVNPGPDDELVTGDQVLLLGQRGQLDRARSVLTRGGLESTL